MLFASYQRRPTPGCDRIRALYQDTARCGFVYGEATSGLSNSFGEQSARVIIYIIDVSF